MKTDLLAFGVHPDDVEISAAGTILVHLALGKTVGIIDLTRGELGTRGTAETRDEEAANAAKILTSINHSTGVSAMPKGEPIMPICEIKKFQKWVDNGTPNN